MDLHANLVDGDWVEGEAVPNVNPANVAEVVGHYARGPAEDAMVQGIQPCHCPAARHPSRRRR